MSETTSQQPVFETIASTSGTCFYCGKPSTVAVRREDLSGWFMCDHHFCRTKENLVLFPDGSNRDRVIEEYEAISERISRAFRNPIDNQVAISYFNILPNGVRPYIALRVHERLATADLARAEQWFKRVRQEALIGYWLS